MKPEEARAELPAGFESLARFVPYWSGATTQLRWDQRASSSMAQITEFYEAMLPHAEAAITLLDTRPLNALDSAESNLMRLLLSLASCAMSVELHGSPRAQYSPFPHGIRVLRGAQPFG